ncbi:hypothetical protein A0256_02530 [Mucilaginibacter sp. PAMC 26640]|nr:hypothetical protein A0256_02530 [Mucilaginibacter sp. PAMC 26640]
MNSVAGRNIKYTYDAGGVLIRKQQYDVINGTTTLKTTDYIDGFIYTYGVLAYFGMPEGRVLNTGGTLKPEYVITDQQGNARISLQENNGVAKVTKENSYYGFGMTLANSPVALPTTPNKNLYNGGSEWQNDYSNLPDLQQTFYRNYDAVLGRFVASDPMAESTANLSGYQYGNDNPIMYNDPLGDRADYVLGTLNDLTSFIVIEGNVSSVVGFLGATNGIDRAANAILYVSNYYTNYLDASTYKK